MTDLEKLNPQQREAVKDTEGAVLVFAGAGSGKTRVLTHRIIYLIDEKNVPAYNILAITFTNKATKEMKLRLSDMLGENDVWVSTFHSLCVKILYRFADKIGYGKNFTIFDESAAKRTLARVLREKHLEDDDKDKYSEHISKAKMAGFTSDRYFAEIRTVEKDAMLICEVIDAYNEALRDSNAMDFDDLLMNCYEVLTTCEEARNYYQNKFKYIHIDEFQDTNSIQFDIVKILSEKWKNVFAVGDDDQGIYSWRGANIKNIQEFDRAFPDAKIYKLEQNYRSTQEILDCANRLIANNKQRTSKTLFSENKGGAKVEFMVSNSDYEEVDRIIDTIVSLKRFRGYLNSDFAILVRNNSLTRLFETNLKKAHLNYKVYGGFKFFDRKEILDIIAYLRILVNDRDNDAVMRVINFPPRGIGDTTVDKLYEYASNNDMSLYDVIMDIDELDFTNAIKTKVRVFREIIWELQRYRRDMSIVDFVVELIEKVGFERYYRSTNKEEDINRWENIEEFLTFMQETYNEDENVRLEEFLQTLAINNEQEDDDYDDSLVISTMHSAKGLEFRVVFVVACEEGILPSAQSIREGNGVEEERRILYVALTRAQERLYVSAVRGSRRKYNRIERAVPSRFFAEAKGEPQRQPAEQRYRFNERYDDDYESAVPTQLDVYSKPKSTFTYTPVTSMQPQTKVYNTSSAGYKSGAKVNHKKFGNGTVISVTGSGAGTIVSVAFAGLGVKKFALMNAPLQLIDE